MIPMHIFAVSVVGIIPYSFILYYLAGLSACKASYQTAVHSVLVRGGHSQSYISQVPKTLTTPGSCVTLFMVLGKPCYPNAR